MRLSPSEYMATLDKQPVVQIRTERSFGADEVEMTSRGCFLRNRNRGISCCNCSTTRFKKIDANKCVTTVKGLNKNLKHDVILSDLKKMLGCDGDKTKEDGGVVIRLDTERTKAVKEFLWKSGLAAQDNIRCSPSV